MRKDFKEGMITKTHYGGTNTNLNKPSRKVLALVLCVILVSVISVGLYALYLNQDHHGLTIVSMELNPTENQSEFIVIVSVQNTGSIEIHEAELNLVFIKDNDIVDSEKQSVDLGTNRTGTFTATFHNILFEPGSTYKAIATIYQDNMLLDTKALTKQFL